MQRTDIDMDKIIEEGVSKLRRDLLTYPVENSKSKCKRLLKNMLGRGEAAPDRFFWPHAMMADALWQYYKFSSDELVLSLLKDYYNRHYKDVQNIKYIDTIMNGYTLIDLYKKTAKTEYRIMLEKMANYLKTAPKARDGSILYRANQNEMVYADTIGMIVPFMCRYGTMAEDEELQELAVKQVINFINNGMDARSGLPYHAYNAETKEKYGIIGWGRAVGWILLGIVEGLYYLGDEKKEQLVFFLNKILSFVVKYQREDGMFSWQLQSIDGPADISATGMILTSICLIPKGQLFFNQYQEVIDKGLKGVKDKQGAYDKCLAECVALGCYPQRYSEYPWGTSSAISFLLNNK